MIAESTSAIGWAYRIPLSSQTKGKRKIIGIKQIPCLQALRINLSVPFPKARNREEYAKSLLRVFCGLFKWNDRTIVSILDILFNFI